MASRKIENQNQSDRFDPIDKLPSNTLKRHPKMDLSKSDLFRLLGYLEGELQGRDITIAALRAEKARQLLYQAKYGRFGLGDPFHALQRDSDGQRDRSFDEAAVKAMYDDQLAQLENLIATQRRAQQRMREQLAAVEKRYHKVCSELDDEKKKHAQDTAQGDDVTYMLEKERERLKQELDFEKAKVKRAERECRRQAASVACEQAGSARHKAVAIALIRERRRLFEGLAEVQEQGAEVEREASQRERADQLAVALADESRRADAAEATSKALQKRLSEEETHRTELSAEVGRLSKVVELMEKQISHSQQRWSGFGRPDDAPDGADGTYSVATVKRTSPRLVATPVTTPQRLASAAQLQQQAAERDWASQRADAVQRTDTVQRTDALQRTDEQRRPGIVNSNARLLPERPVISQKPDTNAASTANCTPGAGGPTVITTPSGTRISLNISPSPTVARRPSPIGRGTPPPIPPNKPQIRIGNSSGARKEIPVKHQTTTSGAATAASKVGITILKDNTMVENSRSSSVVNSAKPVDGTSPSMMVADGQRETRKPSQSTDAVGEAENTSSSSSPSPLLPNMDFFGPEMADLQQLLVSMVTGSTEGSSHSVEDSHSSSSPSPLSVDTLHTDAHTCHANNEDEDVSSSTSFLPLEDHVACATLLHSVVMTEDEEYLQKLLSSGVDGNLKIQDNCTVLHIAAQAGTLGCMKLLLDHGAVCDEIDQSGWTALHYSSANGHLECCRCLLNHAAQKFIATPNGWTAMHCAIQAGHSECLDLLLSHEGSGQSEQTADQWSLDMADVIDNDGWTLAHLAASKSSTQFLDILSRHYDINIEREDRWNQTVTDVASPVCREFLKTHESTNTITCTIAVEVAEWHEPCFLIGQCRTTMETSWTELEEMLCTSLLRHVAAVDAGLTTGVDDDGDNGAVHTTGYQLAVSLDSIKNYHIGLHSWSPGTPSDKSPYTVLRDNRCSQIVVELFGLSDGCMDGVAYESLISMSCLQNYTRILEQYKNIVFSGPRQSGKSYLARKIASCLQSKRRHDGQVLNIHRIELNAPYTDKDFLQLLLDKNCLIAATNSTEISESQTLILDDMNALTELDVLNDIIAAVNSRGPKNTFKLKTAGDVNRTQSYYLPTNLYLILTMNKVKIVPLAIQQQLRSVQLRTDAEPTQRLLHRHLQRRLLDATRGSQPCVRDLVAVKWLLGMWKRMDGGLRKLGLCGLGPAGLFGCAVKAGRPEALLSWVRKHWNSELSVAISAEVVSGYGQRMTSSLRQKVADTVLFVLLQTAVLPGCPLTKTELSGYLSGFKGSNELRVGMSCKPINEQTETDNSGSSDDLGQVETRDGTADSGQVTIHDAITEKMSAYLESSKSKFDDGSSQSEGVTVDEEIEVMVNPAMMSALKDAKSINGWLANDICNTEMTQVKAEDMISDTKDASVGESLDQSESEELLEHTDLRSAASEVQSSLNSISAPDLTNLHASDASIMSTHMKDTRLSDSLYSAPDVNTDHLPYGADQVSMSSPDINRVKPYYDPGLSSTSLPNINKYQPDLNSYTSYVTSLKEDQQLADAHSKQRYVSSLKLSNPAAISNPVVINPVAQPSYGTTIFAVSGTPLPATTTTAPIPSPTSEPDTVFRITHTSKLHGLSPERLFHGDLPGVAGGRPPARDVHHSRQLPNFKGSFERQVVMERSVVDAEEPVRLFIGEDEEDEKSIARRTIRHGLQGLGQRFGGRRAMSVEPEHGAAVRNMHSLTHRSGTPDPVYPPDRRALAIQQISSSIGRKAGQQRGGEGTQQQVSNPTKLRRLSNSYAL